MLAYRFKMPRQAENRPKLPEPQSSQKWIDEHKAAMRDIESNDIYELTLEFIKHNLRLGYAFTNVGCQGRSLGNFASSDGPFPEPERGITIWDTDSVHVELAHLFTGTSRARSGELLQVV